MNRWNLHESTVMTVSNRHKLSLNIRLVTFTVELYKDSIKLNIKY